MATPLPNGIDISAHQDHTPSLVGSEFAFARACYGTFIDSMYANHTMVFHNWQQSHPDFTWGAYLFLRPEDVGGSVEAQVNLLVHCATAVPGGAQLLVIDWETDGAHGAATPEAFHRAVAHLRAQGWAAGVYASLGKPFPWGAGDWDWVAAYDGIEIPHYRIQQGFTFHQYADHSPTQHIDQSRYFGTIAQLHALAGRPDAPVQEDTDTVIAQGGLDVTSDHFVHLKDGTTLYKSPKGTALVAMSADADVDYHGISNSWYAVRVFTAAGYADHVRRPTICYVNPVQADGTHLDVQKKSA